MASGRSSMPTNFDAEYENVELFYHLLEKVIKGRKTLAGLFVAGRKQP